VAFVATYPPRICGIATFTQDLVEAMGGGEIFALQRPGEEVAYMPEVRAVIREDESVDYQTAAQKLNEAAVDLVSLQHEYGIFGGLDGELALDFVQDLQRPLVVTLHTVLRTPTANQARILQKILAKARAVVVMSKVAAQLLEEVYAVPRGQIEIIPHGVPALPAVAPRELKASLNLGERAIILSFGLLGPGKGYEYAIEAMVQVRESHPEALFVILGATHPSLLHREGEAYRHHLEELVKKFDLAEHVRFVNRFVERQELGHWLTAADIFITPYPNLDQIVSGTVTYAMAAGKPVVSTPFAYAVEVLSEERGVLVEPRSSAAFAIALNDLLDHPGRRVRIGARAYRFTRPMLWPQVGQAYRQLFNRVIAAADERPAKPRSAVIPVTSTPTTPTPIMPTSVTPTPATLLMPTSAAVPLTAAPLITARAPGGVGHPEAKANF
jgi:glycosyltransferase involved in cell wall biosynthesis